jgi:hypothetical protein
MEPTLLPLGLAKRVQSRRACLRAGEPAEGHQRAHLQHESRDDGPHGERDRGDDDAGHEDSHKVRAAARAEGLDGVWARVHTDDGDEDDEADIHQQALRRFRERAEHGVAAARPSAGQSDDQNRSGGAEAESHSSYVELQEPQQHARADPAGDESEIGRGEIALDEPDVLRDAVDIIGSPDDLQRVTALERGPWLARHQFGAPAQRLQVHAARIRVAAHLVDRLAHELAVRDDDVARGHRHREQSGIVDFRPDGAIGLEESLPRADTTI